MSTYQLTHWHGAAFSLVVFGLLRYWWLGAYRHARSVTEAVGVRRTGRILSLILFTGLASLYVIGRIAVPQ